MERLICVGLSAFMAMTVCQCAPALATAARDAMPAPNFVHLPSSCLFTSSYRHSGSNLKQVDALGRQDRGRHCHSSRGASGIEASWIAPPARRWIQDSAGVASSWLLGSKASRFTAGVAGGALAWKCLQTKTGEGPAILWPGRVKNKAVALRRKLQRLPSVLSWFCSSSQDMDKDSFSKLPSVVSWSLPNVFLQRRKRELLFEAVVDAEEGPRTYTGLAVDEKEFRLFLAHAVPSRNVDELQVTDRYVDIESKEVRADLRRRWADGRMLMKNISYKEAMAEDRTLVSELKGYLKVRRRNPPRSLVLVAKWLGSKPLSMKYDVGCNPVDPSQFVQVQKLKEFDQEPMDAAQIRDWLSRGYGAEGMQACVFDGERSIDETRETLLPMLHWFRHNYPYYHQACFLCSEASTVRVGNTLSNAVEKQHISGDCPRYNGRTELVYCDKCKAYSRFARYSSLAKILEVGKGRCGEYSTAFYHVMRALGYRTRWVVDWTDHVWVEVDVEGQWMHIDPCEAAFNDKRMYIGWGKKHTYVVAFSEEGLEDVTAEYADDMKEVAKRRDLSEPDLQKALAEAQEAWASNISKAVNV